MDAYHRYKQSIRWLEQFDSAGRTTQFMKSRIHPERYIQRMRYLLKQLGNPDHGLKYVHITGTAGKGTVSTMVHNGLHSAGKRVGLFTSPYCVTLTENIQVNGRLIAPNEFADLVDAVRPVVKAAYRQSPSGGPSYFEILLAIAFLYFQKKRCQWVVLEVGLGGRYDATNVIDAPAVSAITNIGLDHTNILGPTLGHIARDKAGIIKPSGAFFTTEHRLVLLRLFHAVCRSNHVSYHSIARGTNAQESNARLARAILEYIHIPRVAIERGIQQTQLPCRFEVVGSSPNIILDGAHNAMKIHSLMQQIKNVRYRRLIVILGLLGDKDAGSIARSICSRADRIILTHGTTLRKSGRKWMPASQLATAFHSSVASVITTEKSLFKALRLALVWANSDDCILITGSFYLTGALRAQWHSEKVILQRRSSF